MPSQWRQADLVRMWCCSFIRSSTSSSTARAVAAAFYIEPPSPSVCEFMIVSVYITTLADGLLEHIPSLPCMSAVASSSTPAAAAPAPSPVILLFARGVLSLFQSWTVMRSAVLQSWGGPESEAKRTWFASMVVDEFEERWTKAGCPLYPAVAPDADASSRQNIAPPEGLDLDDLADLLFDVFLEEFDVELEDGSPEEISRRVIACWSASLQGDESAIVALEEEAARFSKKKADVVQTAAGDHDGDSSSDDDEEEGGMDVDPAPARQERVREEPEIDDDGFTMVKKGKGKK